MAATRLNEMGRWNPDAIERQLAHQEANAVRRAYTHSAVLARARIDDAGMGGLSRRASGMWEGATADEGEGGLIALSRRKQGFESPRERQ